MKTIFEQKKDKVDQKQKLFIFVKFPQLIYQGTIASVGEMGATPPSTKCPRFFIY